MDEAEVACRPFGSGGLLDYRYRVSDNWWYEHWHQQESWLSLRQTGKPWARCQSVQWVWETDQVIHHKQWQRTILSKGETSFWNNRRELGKRSFSKGALNASSSRLSEKEKEQISEQLNALSKTYHDLCEGSANQLQQLQSQLAQQTEQKVLWVFLSRCWKGTLGTVWLQLCWLRVMITSFPWPVWLNF